MWQTIAEYAARLWADPKRETKSAAKGTVRLWQSARWLRWAATCLLLSIVLGVLCFTAWQCAAQGGGRTTVYQGEKADVTTVEAPWLPLETIPVMDYPPGADTTDGVAIPDLRKIAVARSDEVEVAITSSALPGHAILIRRRDPVFGDFRDPSLRSDAEVICIQEGGCTSTPSVSAAVPPRPFAQWTGDLGVGAGLYPGAETWSQARAFYVSASMLRLGPARLGLGLRETMGHDPALAGLPVDLAPEVSTQVVENVELTGSYGTWQGEPMLGVRVTR